MKGGLTPTERRQFDEAGYLVFDDVLTPRELGTLNRVADRLYDQYGGNEAGRLEVRNCVARDPAFLRLVAHPGLLPVVVDLLGPDIKIRTSELDIRPPLTREAVEGTLGTNQWGKPEQWHIDGPIYGYPSVNGIVPLMEVRVGYYLTDLREPKSGQLYLVPGSHHKDYRQLMDPSINPRKAVRVDVAPGGAALFRTGVWHCTSANRSARTRKVLYFAYTYRWIHGSDYVAQSPTLLERCSPIQRQLLGASARPGRHLLGSDPTKTPCSLFWFTEPCDIPLLAASQMGWKNARRLRRSGVP